MFVQTKVRRQLTSLTTGEDITACKFVTRRHQNMTRSRCRIRVGGSECLRRGCTVLPSVDRNAVGGAGTGGLMTSCCGFLFTHRKMPEEQEKGEEWREEKTSGRVTAGAHEETHTCMTGRHRERSRQSM